MSRRKNLDCTEFLAAGVGSFRNAAPVLWNGLPPALKTSSSSVQSFRRCLKTHFFLQILSAPCMPPRPSPPLFPGTMSMLCMETVLLPYKWPSSSSSSSKIQQMAQVSIKIPMCIYNFADAWCESELSPLHCTSQQQRLINTAIMVFFVFCFSSSTRVYVCDISCSR